MTEDDRESQERARRLEALSQVIGRFAHDFSNVLATIVLNLGLIEKKCSDPTSVGLAGSALRAADRGTNLANRLLAFCGKQTLSRAPLDLGGLISGMRDLLSRTLGPAVELVLSCPKGVWRAWADCDQIEFVLTNLAENARDAMPRGGQLTIDIANARIAAPTADLAPGEYVVLTLEDTGEGLSEEVMQRAFEPFFSTRRGQEHPGLGLSAVLGIAKAHGGSARLTRAAGGGCRVEIYLPRATEAEIRAASDSEIPQLPPRESANTTVLVVDDNPDLLAVVQEGLAGLGYDVLLAQSGPVALKILASPSFVDLLMVDLTMAGMDGLELIRRAREMRPSLKALFMTGAGEIPGLGKSEHEPVLLRKPFRTADLAQALAVALAGDATR